MRPEGGRQTYFGPEELAAKMQSLQMCERPRHVRENEMFSHNCQMRRVTATICLWFDKAVIVITVLISLG